MAKKKVVRKASRKPAGPTAPESKAFEIGSRVSWQAHARPYHWTRAAGNPLTRQLWIYTLDPSLSDRHGGMTKVEVPWEKLEAGPKGVLFDIDGTGAPSDLSHHGPLDLDDPRLLVTNGLSPSPSNAQFHLQMAYAVCSLTYAAFRRALGRDLGWAFPPGPDGETRLRVRPFALKQPNAGYLRETQDLSFGYFRAGRHPAGFTIPGGLVFTALSHDVICLLYTSPSPRD